MQNFKVAIVGGGAVGLISAIILSEKINGDKIVILEKLDRVGKKIAATGNGQGNITNKDLSIQNYYGDKEFISSIISKFTNENLIEFLNKLGGFFVVDERGRYYPSSFQASSVLDILRMRLAAKNVMVMTNFNVVDINEDFIIQSENGEKIKAENVILAFGGSSSKQFGTDGKSYHLATKFGHTLTDLYPSLAQLKTEINLIKALKGIRVECVAKAFDGDKFIKCEKGDVIFTDLGVSGNAIFQISGHLLKVKNPYVFLEFLPSISHLTLKEILIEKINNCDIELMELFTCILNKALGRVILKECGYNNLTLNAKVALNNIDKIVFMCKNFKLKVLGSIGFNYSQVTKGGIATSEIDKNTLMSNYKKNLYLGGELLDVDGDCGGYNLQWAFSCGFVCAKSILKNINA